ncbi:MAG TPA: ATP-binding protein, partial [Kofleriaceae bacterium]|nr:ATP-binding protein [Kofleriaceae bacterium]
LPPYVSAREHLDDMLDLVASRTALAIARAWNSGQLSAGFDPQPFAREVHALLGDVPNLAPGELVAADERLARMAQRNAGRLVSTIAAGIRLPFIELMRELDLSPTASHVVMVTMAASERGEIARLFGILANDPHRPLVDRFLLETIIGGPDRRLRAEVAAALADDAPLRRHCVIRCSGDPGLSTFQAITVDPIVIARLTACVDRATRDDVRLLDDLVVPREVVTELLAILARPRSSDAAVRVVIRGRLGSGRRSLIAALAARIGRTIGEVDCTRLPRAGAAMAAALQRELGGIVLRGEIPIVSGLDAADPTDTEGQDRIRQVLRDHPGPLVVRTTPEATLSLDRGFATVTLPPLSETERARFWRGALARVGLASSDVDGLAARWRIGPGVVESVIAQVCARELEPGADATAALDEVARQHIASRLGHIATPVRRLAAWENVALADDVIDSIREFIGRIAQRRTVFEDWGFDAKVASSRGLTALFYGPPGTGKSMVAGLIARELGLELYRVDLARVVSKWIGETEKHLAEVFDAAEDGQVVILFDEADSLFAKRTEVRTSVDRYANLEVNYLLQRLDTFEGIAILTTNLDGSIDPAFKRRMSLRLQFPFPDEDMRKRLWAAHIPNQAPVAGDFNFAELARRFPLSGGYIRNSALRAAFLAAQERRPMGQEHLLRAIALEYRELGKLATDGRME